MYWIQTELRSIAKDKMLDYVHVESPLLRKKKTNLDKVASPESESILNNKPL